MTVQEITVSSSGPILVAGNATYTDAEGNQQTTPGKMIALCRCGESANKPFCDGVHKKIGFEAAEVTLTLSDA